MTTEITNPDEDYKLSPEALEITTTYLECHDTKETAEILGIEQQKVTYTLRKPDVKRFIDTIFLEQGYMNQSKIQDVMDNLIKIKLEEMEDTEMGSNKDILDILTLQHKMRMEIIKAQQGYESKPAIKNQINVQQNGTNFGTNLDALTNALNKGA